MKRIFKICLLLLGVVVLCGCEIIELFDDTKFVDITYRIIADSNNTAVYEVVASGNGTLFRGVFCGPVSADLLVVDGLPDDDKAYRRAETPWHYARDVIFGEGAKFYIYERGGKPFQKLIYTFTQDDIGPNSVFLYENWTLEIDDRNWGGPLIHTKNIRYIYTYKFTPPEAAEE